MSNVLLKTSGGYYSTSIESRLLDERKIFIEGEITGETAIDFTKKLIFLQKEDPKAPVDIFITSEGGEITAGLCIFDGMLN